MICGEARGVSEKGTEFVCGGCGSEGCDIGSIGDESSVGVTGVWGGMGKVPRSSLGINLVWQI